MAQGDFKSELPEHGAGHAPGPMGGRFLRHRRALVVVCDTLEREAIRAVLGGWGCETVGAASVAQVALALPPVPDVLIVGGSPRTEQSGAIEVACLRALYALRLPTILIGETDRAVAVETETADYLLLPPHFAPADLRAALAKALSADPGPPPLGESF